MVVFPPYSLQRTPMHRMADVNVHMMTDEFMSQLTAELGVEIPPFKLHRRMRVTTGKGKDGETVLLVPFPSLASTCSPVHGIPDLRSITDFSLHPSLSVTPSFNEFSIHFLVISSLLTTYYVCSVCLPLLVLL